MNTPKSELLALLQIKPVIESAAQKEAKQRQLQLNKARASSLLSNVLATLEANSCTSTTVTKNVRC